MTDIDRIIQLRNELHQHNNNYYVLNSPTISDQEFDQLLRELQDLEHAHPEAFDPNSPTQRVGSDLNNEFQTVLHRRPMLSLSNTYNRQASGICNVFPEGIRNVPERTMMSFTNGPPCQSVLSVITNGS